MTRKENSKSVLAITAIILFFVFSVGSYFSPAVVEAVTVGPAKLEYNIDPGTVIKGEMYLKNEEKERKTFYPSYEKFSEPVGGQKVFSKDKSTLSLWIKTEKSVTLESGADIKIPFTIEVPTDAPPGGHFAIVWWSTSPPAESGESQVSIVTRAGILVYLNVSGEVQGDAHISSFSTNSGKNLFWGTPVPLPITFAVKNEMNIYIKPVGEIKITNLFGKTREAISLNPKGLQILPQSIRNMDNLALVREGFMFGPYKVTADLSYAEDKTDAASFWIWVLPLKVLIVLILVLLFIVFGVPRLLKKYKERIIAQALKAR